MARDGEVRAKYFEFIIVELLHVVEDKNLMEPKPTNDVFPNKYLEFLLVISTRGSASTHFVK